MSGGVRGPAGGGERADWPQADPAKTDALLKELESAEGRGPRLPRWLSCLDPSSSTWKLAKKLLADGKFDAEDAKKLVADAKDFGRVTFQERQVFAMLLRDHADKMTPEAREALSKFAGIPLRRP